MRVHETSSSARSTLDRASCGQLCTIFDDVVHNQITSQVTSSFTLLESKHLYLTELIDEESQKGIPRDL